MASRIFRLLVLLLLGGTGLAVFRRIAAKVGGEKRLARKPAAAPRPQPVAARRKAAPRSGHRGLKLPVRRVLWIAGILLLAGSVTFALFTKTTTNTGNTYAAAADFRAPTVDRSTVLQIFTNETGAGNVAAGRVYFIYANVSDTGNPASGISSVTANACNVTSGAGCGSVAMNSGSYTVNGVSYNYQSGSLTADPGLTEGSKSYSINASDNNSNSGNTGFNLNVDNTAPTVARQIACGGSGCTTTGYVGASKTYYVYAQVTDSASGVDTVTTDPRNITASASATTAMSASGGPWTIGGNSYNYRSIQLTGDSGLTNASTKSYTVTTQDKVWNSTSPSANATVDNVAPTVGTPDLDKNFGQFQNHIRANANYVLYAEPSDAASGVDTAAVTANVDVDASNRLTTGATSVKMCYSAGGYSVPVYHTTTPGVYHYKSDSDGVCDGSFTLLTTDSGLPEVSRNWNVTVADNAGNSATGSRTANINNTSNAAVDAKISNTSGGTIGKLELGDQVNFNFNGTNDPAPALAGWSGNAADGSGNVVARLIDGGGSCVASSDQLQVFDAANTTATKLGTVCLGGTGYNATGSTITFGATGTPSTLEAAFTNPFQLTLGTSSNPTCTGGTGCTQATDTTATWTPSSGMYDLSGNSTLTTPASYSIDNTAPTISGTRICGGSACSADYVGQGKAYFIYANASDANAGIDGTNGVKADVSNITTGATSVALTTCSSNCTVNGTTYGYKSAQQTANGSLSGTKNWTLTVKDQVSNQATTTPTATVDNNAPTLTRAQIQRTANNNPGFFKQGDQYYVYAELADTGGSGIDPAAITANVAVASNVISTGKTSVTMCSNGGPFTVGGQSYTYRSDDDGVCGGTAVALTSDASITDGSKTYNVTFDDNANNVTTGTPSVTEDSTAPSVTASTLSKQTGYLKDRLKSAVAYFPYANVTDAGVGVSTVTANVNNITAGQTALAMVSGSYSTQGVSYNYRPASTVTSGTLTNGASLTWTLAVTDSLGNTASPSGTNATADTAVPDASDIQCTNSGTAGLPNNGDICNFTHTENIDPFSVSPIASWTGTSTTVAVRFLDAGTGSVPAACDTGLNDTVVIYNAANSAQITAMGCVNLGDDDYVTANQTCTSSTLIQPAVPGAVNRVTLGGCPTFTAGSGTSTLGYYPSTSLYDAAGNNLTDTTVQNETGTADRDF
jgi:hypothetical protein